MRNEYPQRDLFSPAQPQNIDLSKEIRAPRLRSILYALQALYIERPDMIQLIFKDLTRYGAPNKGREGMDAWRALILLALRTGLDFDYNMLTEFANNHEVIRRFMGVRLTEEFHPSRSSIHETIMLLRQETIEAVNTALVEIGAKKNFEDGSVVRGDSFVCRTNTHYPTDVNLILDGIEGILSLCVEDSEGTNGWRQHKHLRKKAKQLYRSYMQLKRSTRTHEKKAADIAAASRSYINFARTITEKALSYLAAYHGSDREAVFFPVQDRPIGSLPEQIRYFITATEYVCNLAERRIIEGETIEHKEKVHSLHEPHTELINRGKYPTPIEFGHRVFLGQGKSGLILSHQVMGVGVTDDKILIPVLQELQERFKGKLEVASFDKGFYTPDNLRKAGDHCKLVVIPRKGRLSAEARAEQSDKEYVTYRHWRSGVESLISAMVRSNGLGRCPDKGYRGYCKYVSACVLSRNLQTLGGLLMEAEKEKERRKLKKTA